MVWLVFAFAKTYSRIIQIDYNTANCFLITNNTLSCCLIAQQEAERARFLVEKVRGGGGKALKLIQVKHNGSPSV